MRVISSQILILKALQVMSTTHVAPKAMKIQMVVVTGQQKERSLQIKLILMLTWMSLADVVFEDDLKPHNIVELIINDRLLDLCNEATNAHEKKMILSISQEMEI